MRANSDIRNSPWLMQIKAPARSGRPLWLDPCMDTDQAWITTVISRLGFSFETILPGHRNR